jgi:CubicO group peptidase (beta-lactamase class C family)
MKILLCLFLLIPAIISCRPPADPPVSDRYNQAIQQYVQKRHDSGLFDGTVLVADSTGIIYKGAFGLSDREKNIPLEPETLFYLASVSKQFTATAILLLLQQGRINLDDKIIKYLPGLPDAYRLISFRHLLTHTSGIPDYYAFTQPTEGFNNQDVFRLLMDVDSLEFLPGDRHQYSNSGYVLLSILTDSISGSGFADFLKEHAFSNAGLEQTIVFDEHAGQLEKRALGYGPDNSITDYKFRTTGGGGIFSNVEDLYNWHLAMSSGKILKPEIQKLAFQPTRLNQDSFIYYGFGWEIDPEDPGHVYHGGDLEGFRTWFDRHLPQQTVIILLSNNSSGKLKEMADEIYKIIGKNN